MALQAVGSIIVPSAGQKSGHKIGLAGDAYAKPVELKTKPTASAPGVLVVPPPPKESNLQTHYDELLRVIGEVGKDIKPAYTNSKVSADRLKRNIAFARGVLRDCLNDIEKLHQITPDK